MSRLMDRVERRLQTIRELDRDVQSLLCTGQSAQRFDSRAELQRHLTEGALLNITRLASNCLSIPSGDYVVWLTDSGRTVLVPTRTPAAEVHPKVEDKYEIHTGKLLGIWNKLERTLAETTLVVREASPGERPDNWQQSSEPQDVGGHFDQAPERMPDEPYTFGRNVGRTALWQAMQRAQMGVSDLANAVGVDKSTVSRLLRDVEHGPGDPHGRNPSVALAQKIAQILGVDVDQVLPPPEDTYVSHRKATSGSGRGGAGSLGGKGNPAFSAGGGAIAAGRERPLSAVCEQIARLMVECQVDPVQFITESLIGNPANELVLNEFLGQLDEWNPLSGMGQKLGLGGGAANQDEKLFDTAIHAIKSIVKAHGPAGYTARVGGEGGKKMQLTTWLNSVMKNLVKIKQKMPEVQAKHAAAKPEEAAPEAMPSQYGASPDPPTYTW